MKNCYWSKDISNFCLAKHVVENKLEKTSLVSDTVSIFRIKMDLVFDLITIYRTDSVFSFYSK